MGSINETVKDSEGNNLVIFDESSLYDDNQMGNYFSDFEVLQILTEDEDKNNNDDNNNNYNNYNIIEKKEKKCFVTKVRSLKNNKLYAMKKIVSDFQHIDIDSFLKLTELNNPHILKYYKTIGDNNNNLYLIMELMNNDNINNFIKAHYKVNQRIKEEEIWNILLQCTSALDYLHKQKLSSLGIRFTNIYMNNEQNAKISVFSEPPTARDKNYNLGEDILLLGRFFYKMIFCHLERVQKSQRIEDIQLLEEENNYYSKDLKDIIFSMIRNNRPNSSTLYDTVKKKYVEKYARNTSINAVLRCLISYKNLNNIICIKNRNHILSNKEKYYINHWYIMAYDSLSGFSESNINLNECIEEFRRAIAFDNSKLDGNKEIDPLYLLGFLLEKMHKETNRINENINQGNNELNKKKTNSFFNDEEDKTNKDQMLHKFTSNYNKNIHSPISDLFLGIAKRKRICSTCGYPNYSFNNFCFVFFDLSKRDSDEDFNLNKGFEDLHENGKDIKAESSNRIYCKRCLSYQDHTEYNRFYQMNKQLIICFIRGNDFKNESKIIFEEKLDVKGYVDKKDDSPFKYKLVGSINRIINEKGNEEFVYFAKDPENEIWHMSVETEENRNDDAIIKDTPMDLMQKTGNIILLFYDLLKNYN